MSELSKSNYAKFEREDSVDLKIEKCVSVLHTKGVIVPTQIKDIPEFPCNDFDHLQKRLC